MSMTLAFPLLSEPIVFRENEVPILVVEHEAELRRLLFMLQQQIDGLSGEFILAEDYAPVELSKKAFLVTDPFALDFDSKKISGKIDQEAIAAGTVFADTFQKILDELNKLACNISTMLDFEATFSELEDWKFFLKYLNFHIDRYSLDFSSQLIEFLKLQRRFFGRKLGIFYNIKAILTNEELRLLYETIQYEKLQVLFIEDSQRRKISSDERVVIIDPDLCVF